MEALGSVSRVRVDIGLGPFGSDDRLYHAGRLYTLNEHNFCRNLTVRAYDATSCPRGPTLLEEFGCWAEGKYRSCRLHSVHDGRVIVIRQTPVEKESPRFEILNIDPCAKTVTVLTELPTYESKSRWSCQYTPQGDQKTCRVLEDGEHILDITVRHNEYVWADKHKLIIVRQTSLYSVPHGHEGYFEIYWYKHLKRGSTYTRDQLILLNKLQGGLKEAGARFQLPDKESQGFGRDEAVVTYQHFGLAYALVLTPLVELE